MSTIPDITFEAFVVAIIASIAIAICYRFLDVQIFWTGFTMVGLAFLIALFALLVGLWGGEYLKVLQTALAFVLIGGIETVILMFYHSATATH